MELRRMPLPTARHAPTRKSVACFGAVNVRTGQLCTALEPKFNALSFGAFLRRLLKRRRSGQRMVIVLDNAKYHHARLLQPWLQQHRAVLTLLFLPPYSPEL